MIKPKTSLYLLSGLAAMSCNTFTEREAERPNIILIMADDITPEHFGCYGGKMPTPTIDSLAAAGAVFSRAYCTSAACTPSRFSILTGLYANRSTHPEYAEKHQAEEPYNLEWNTYFVDSDRILHEALKEAGYFTGFVGKYHSGQLGFDTPGSNGLPEFSADDLPGQPETEHKLQLFQHIIKKEIQNYTGADYVASALWKNFDEFFMKELRYHNLEWITEGAVNFFDSIPEGKPWFLYIATSALHGPNHATNLLQDPHFTPGGKLDEPYRYHPDRKTIFERVNATGRFINAPNYNHPQFDTTETEAYSRELARIDHYNTGVVYLDDQIKAIMKKLKQTGQDKNTLIIITADHGVEPGKSTCYEKGIKVPFIAIWPGKIKPGQRIDQMVQFVDFMPTFEALAGIPAEKQTKTDGKDILPLLTGEGDWQRSSLFFEMGYTRAVTDGRYKYIATRYPAEIQDSILSGKQTFINHLNWFGQVHASITLQYYPGYFDADQLYDLQSDPYEQKNLAIEAGWESELLLMQTLLNSYLTQFGYPFDLTDTMMFSHPAYKKAVTATKESGTIFIPWWPQAFAWPPVY